ncbi:MAG: methionyl-tRNA formyltransferase [Patescibacteria group bacterium]|nr:methionyl-tRNA formyltransferase [Patescibacteria group bacterium]
MSINNNLNFAFFGTPEISKQTLEILYASGYIPKVIITSADQRSGRGMHLKETEVSLWAKNHKILCLKPEKIDQKFIDEFKKYDIDLSIVVAYGKILPESLIKTPRLGTINIHYSLLPKYRGASPVEEALINGDEFTGISIQKMVFDLDSGPIITQEEVNINQDETKTELLNRLANIGGRLLVDILPDIFNNKITLKQQDGPATYCKKIKKESGLLDLNDNPLSNYNKYRAFTDWPGAYFFLEKNGKQTRVKIKRAEFKNNSFVIKRIIPEGKKEMNYEDFIRSSNI